MMRSPWNRGGRSSENQIDEGRLSALLGSNFADKLILEQDAKLRAARERQAAEIKRLTEEELRQVPEFNAKVSNLNEALLQAQSSLHRAQLDLSAAVQERDGFMLSSQRLRRAHEMELVATTPKIVDDAINYLFDLLHDNQSFRISETVDTKNLMAGKTGVILTDGPAARAWRPTINAAIAALEAMKLDPDHTKFEKRIDEILSAIPDPKNLPVTKITIDPASLSPKIEKVE